MPHYVESATGRVRIKPGQVWMLGNARLEIIDIEPCGAVNFKPPYDPRLMEPWSYTVKKNGEKVKVKVEIHYCLMHNAKTKDGTIRCPILAYDKDNNTFEAHVEWSVWQKMTLAKDKD